MRQTALDASAKIAEALVVGGRTGYREKFYLYGFFGILDEWVKRRFTEAPEEVAEMLDGRQRPHAARDRTVNPASTYDLLNMSTNGMANTLTSPHMAPSKARDGIGRS